ncbi:unnamed protein product [Lathyrus oleraceus]
MTFTVNFYYGRKFVRENVIYYLGGHAHIVDIDPDKWNFFEAICIVKDLCQLEHSKYWLWWYNNESDKHSRTLSDSDVNEVYKFTVEMKCVVDIYVKHKVVNIGVVNVEEECGVNDDDDDDDDDEVNVNVEDDCVVNVNVDDGGVNVKDDVNVEDESGVNLKDDFDVNINDDDGGGVNIEDDGGGNDEGVINFEEDEHENNYDNDDSGFEANGISFDDIEDERALELDDDFDLIDK